MLTHWGLVTHVRVSEMSHRRFIYWLAIWSARRHNINQFWIIVNWVPRNKCGCNCINIHVFSYRETLLKVQWANTAAISCQWYCVKCWLCVHMLFIREITACLTIVQSVCSNKQTSKLGITCPLWWETTDGFPLQRIIAESVLCHAILRTWWRFILRHRLTIV